MKIKIGDNIRLHRKKNNLTQEQLAEIFNVSAASVCKWESGESFPDITLLFPIATFFKISIDSLMGYNEELLENDILNILEEYNKMPDKLKWNGKNKLILEARKKYPQDYRIMHKYMFEIIGGFADNNSESLVTHCDELQEICETLLAGCKDEKLRLDALTVKAKILHAKGKTTEAIILLNSFPSYYHSSNQRKEQLFNKDTLEYFKELVLNLEELARFAADKLAKSIIYDVNLRYEEKINKIKRVGNCLSYSTKNCESKFFRILKQYFWIRIIEHPYPQIDFDKETLKKFIEYRNASNAEIESFI